MIPQIRNKVTLTPDIVMNIASRRQILCFVKTRRVITKANKKKKKGNHALVHNARDRHKPEPKLSPNESFFKALTMSQKPVTPKKIQTASVKASAR